jgi:hypothetical protein
MKLNYYNFIKDFSSTLIFEESIEAFVPKGNAIKEDDRCKNTAKALNKSILDFIFHWAMINTLYYILFKVK